jgi:hypothetical protein
MGGGFPLQPIQTELKAMGLSPVRPPTSEASTIEALQKLWSDAGLVDVERRFVDFEDFWGAAQAPTLGQFFASMPPEAVADIKTRVRAHLKEDNAGRITYGAWANAIKGRLRG